MADSGDSFRKQHPVVPADDSNVDDDDVDLGDAIVEGENSISGTQADPSSDDNVRTAAQAVGLYDDENEEAPEVDIAGEIEKDEKAIRNMPPPGSPAASPGDSDDDDDDDTEDVAFEEEIFPEEDEE